MTWLITAKQYIPAVIGEPWGGGYFAGYISHTANGSPTHVLIVAPRATGATGTGYTLTTSQAWKTAQTSTSGTDSVFDGAANTAAMVTAGINDHPAAKFCKDLTIGGFTDWYLPSRAELEIAYFNLKPTTDANSTGFGSNIYAVPRRDSNYTAGNPAITPVALFNTSTQAFVATDHWSSTQLSATNGSYFYFLQGVPSSAAKTIGLPIRAFRRIAL